MRIFNSILNENKTIVTYVVMMKSYNKNEMYDKTIKLFNSHELNDIKNDVCYLLALLACKESKNISLGKKIYNEIIHHEKYCENIQLLNLIDECEKIEQFLRIIS